MSQPVKPGDELVLEARTMGSSSQRSIAGQVEFWAKLGRSVEPLLRGDRALSLLQAGEARALSMPMTWQKDWIWEVVTDVRGSG